VKLIPTSEIVSIAKDAGYDSLFIELEHSSFSLSQASQLCAAGIMSGITPFVRVSVFLQPLLVHLQNFKFGHDNFNLEHSTIFPGYFLVETKLTQMTFRCHINAAMGSYSGSLTAERWV